MPYVPPEAPISDRVMPPAGPNTNPLALPLKSIPVQPAGPSVPPAAVPPPPPTSFITITIANGPASTPVTLATPPIVIAPPASQLAPPAASQQALPIYVTVTQQQATNIPTTFETRTAYEYLTTLKTAYDVHTSTETATAYTTVAAAWQAGAGCHRIGVQKEVGPTWAGKDCKAGPLCEENGNTEDGSSIWVGRDCAVGV
jgi:hypothetical protein